MIQKIFYIGYWIILVLNRSIYIYISILLIPYGLPIMLVVMVMNMRAESMPITMAPAMPMARGIPGRQPVARWPGMCGLANATGRGHSRMD